MGELVTLKPIEVVLQKPNFDFGLVSQEQAMQLREITIRLNLRVQRTAEEMLAMGADLQEAKRVCKEDGTLFTAWCESSECPIGYKTAQRMIAINHEFGGMKKDTGVLFQNGFMVLSTITQTRDEDIRQALLEHIQQKAEEGETISKREVEALKKSLVQVQKQAEEAKDEAFEAKKELERIAQERAEMAKERDEEKAKKDQYTKDLLAADRKLKDAKQALEDAEEVYREQLAEETKRIQEAERKRPQTTEEEKAAKQRLKELKDKINEVQQETFKIEGERRELKRQLEDERAAVKLRDKIMGDFQKYALKYREIGIGFIGATGFLRQLPMTNPLHEQIDAMLDIAKQVVNALTAAKYIDSDTTNEN